ncbi:MAG: hypothetical protein ACXVDJ_08710, partial [Tumebacillaceae bacterium]
MSDDRLQMPEQLEKAFEYLKQAPMPSDYELGKQRALLWEQIEKRGRRFRLLDRWWKPSVGALTAALVVVAALVVPHHVPDKGIEVKQGNMSASQPFLTQQQLDEERLNKSKMYAQQGKQFLETEHSTGIDLVIESPEKSNQNVLYAVKNGVSHQIYSYSKSYKIRSGIFAGTPMLEFEFFLDDKSDVRVDSNLYVLNPQTMQVKSLVWDA